MFSMMMYDILDANADCQNEKVPFETHPLTDLVLLPNSRQITIWFDHLTMKTEETYNFFFTYILRK